jgi:hypothetical protein
MPKDYAGLCRMFLPRPIHHKADYENAVEIADPFAGFEHNGERKITADHSVHLGSHFGLRADVF